MENAGTVISLEGSPSTSEFSFVVNSNNKQGVKKGQYVQAESEDGIVFGYVNEIVRANRYFEQAESVAEYEKTSSIKEHFPIDGWEHLVATTKVLGTFKDERLLRTSLPPFPGSTVIKADDELLKKFLGFDENGLRLGKVQHHELEARLCLTKLLQKHLAILAMSGAGKCVKYDTPVSFPDGKQRKIGELADELFKNKKPQKKDGIESVVLNNELRVLSLNNDFKVEPTSIYAVTRRRSPKKLIYLETKTGRKIELTPEHPLLIMNENGPEWKTAKELTNEDFVAVPRQIEHTSEINELNLLELYKNSEKMRAYDKKITIFLKKEILKKKMKISRELRYQLNSGSIPLKTLFRLLDILDLKKMNVEIKKVKHETSQSYIQSKLTLNRKLGKFVGYLMGDGHVRNNCIHFCSVVPELKEDFKKLTKELFNFDVTTYEKDVRIYSKTLVEILNNIFGVRENTEYKNIPDLIKTANLDFIGGFISGLFDADGTVAKEKPEVEFATINEHIAEAVSKLLLNFGILSVIKKAKNKKYGRIYYRVFIRGSENLGVFQKNISFTNKKKQKRLERVCKLIANTNIDVVPKLGNFIVGIANKLRISVSELQRRSNSSNISRYKSKKNELSTKTFKQIAQILRERKTELENFINSTKKFVRKKEHAYSKVSGTNNPFHDDIDSFFQCAKNMVVPYQSLDRYSGLWKGAWATFERGERNAHFDHKINMVEGIKKVIPIIEEDLESCEEKIKMCELLGNSQILWDRIRKIKNIKSGEKYVYDLALKNNHNFLAGSVPIIIHNSHFAAVLLEELMNRKKEDGRISIVVIDIHGEYLGFKHDEKYGKRVKVVEGNNIKVPFKSMSPSTVMEWFPEITYAGKSILTQILGEMRKEMKNEHKFYGLKDLNERIIAHPGRENIKEPLKRAIQELRSYRLVSKKENPRLSKDLKAGEMLILDLSDIDNMKKKRMIVAYLGRRLFKLRKKGKIAPFLLLVEEAHNFATEKMDKYSNISKPVIETIAREGRKFGACLCLISQRPVNLSTTALSQCNTNVILRVTNPNDLDHIGRTSEGIDHRMLRSVTSLKVGEGIIVGEAVKHPIFVEIRDRTSRKMEKGEPLADQARKFEESLEKKKKDVEAFL